MLSQELTLANPSLPVGVSSISLKGLAHLVLTLPCEPYQGAHCVRRTDSINAKSQNKAFYIIECGIFPRELTRIVVFTSLFHLLNTSST